MANDIGLVITASDIAIGGKVQPIPVGTSIIGDGVTATLTGWGVTSVNISYLKQFSITLKEFFFSIQTDKLPTVSNISSC
jgi:hypothetical protein